MKVGVPKETVDGERRVGIVPGTVEKLVKQELEVLVERGAGRDFHLDAGYEEAGARLVDTDELYGEADVLAKVQPPTEEEVGRMHRGTLLVSFLQPLTRAELVGRLAEAGVTAISMDAIPRIARAQSMDALSSMGSISGYKCALVGADNLGKYLPMMTTAAGTTKAAKVLVLGVGVAGLQAIATSRRLGAEVSAFDIRPETKDQVKSLGATFIDSEPEQKAPAEPEEPDEEPGGLSGFVRRVRIAMGAGTGDGRAGAAPGSPAKGPGGNSGGPADGGTEHDEGDTGGYAREQSEEKQRQDQELMRSRLPEMDIVITTALVPGRKAPTLLTREMVEEMHPGSVVVDLAAENGGNCEVTEPGETIDHEQVTVIGPVNVPSSVPIHASELYSRNVLSLLDHLVAEGELNLDFEDQITADACLTHEGEVRHEGVREALSQGAGS